MDGVAGEPAATPAGCLDAETAAAFVDGALSAAASAQVEAHVDGCPSCRSLLVALAVAARPAGADDDAERALRTESLLAGSTVSRYRIVDRLGSGAMGVVYRATDPDLGREVALKLVQVAASSAERADARLLREARALAQLSHPNVVPVYDVGTYGGAVFFAMELLGGGTLGAWLRALPRPLGAAEARAVLERFVAAGRGLQAAHDAGLVHRDFKPDNVLLAAGGRVCVTDFGLVRAVGPGAETASAGGRAEARDADDADEAHRPLVTGDGAIVGTPAYMAPEQLAGAAATAQSDQFAFCVALYEALHGQAPFAGETVAALRAAIEAGEVAPAPSSAAGPELRAILERGLRVDPGARFSSMADLLGALETADDAPLPRTRRRSSVLVALGITLAATLAVAAVPSLRRRAADPCAAAARPMVETWSAATRHAVLDAFRGSSALRADAVAAQVSTKLDTYATDWEQAARATCRAAHGPAADDPQVHALRQECLDRQLEELRPVVDTLVHAGVATVPSASELLASLPEVKTCEDVSTSPARMKPPDPRIAAQVTDLRRQLAQARALTLVDQGKAALAIAEPAAASARSLGYAPLTAQALLTLGLAQSRTASDPRALRTLLEAVDLAEASRNDAVAALGWTSLVRAHLMIAGDGASAQRALARAQAAIQRLDGQSAAAERLRDNEAFLAMSTGHFTRADELFDAHLASLAQRFGDGDILLASPLEDRGRSLRYTGEYARAAAGDERAVSILSSYLGAEATRTAQAATDLGIDLTSLGRYAEAETTLEHARATFEHALGPDHTFGVFTLLALGDLCDRTGRLEEGLAFTAHGAAIEEKTFGRQHPAIAFSQSALAEAFLRRGRYAEALAAAQRSAALWSALGETGAFEKERALAAVGLAQLGLGKVAAAKATLGEVVAYLDTHEGLRPVRQAASEGLSRIAP